VAELLRAAARAAQPWRNGGGVTFEVARRPHPSAAREYLWRVSIARVATAGPFSAFHGFQRVIMVIEGSGMSLRGLGAADVVLERDQPCRFDGATPVEGLIPRGPISDLNVIFDPDHCDARLRVLTGPAPRDPAAGSERLLINLARAPIQWRSGNPMAALGYLDAVWLPDALEPCEHTGIERAAWIEIVAR
jgi:environmental stress-induced protein Ves